MFDNIPRLKTVFHTSDELVTFYVNDHPVSQWTCCSSEAAERMQDNFVEAFLAGIKSTGNKVALAAHGDVEIVHE